MNNIIFRLIRPIGLTMTRLNAIHPPEERVLRQNSARHGEVRFLRRSNLIIAGLLRQPKVLLAIMLIFTSCTLYAASSIYNFSSRQNEQRFYTLTSALRCLVCQNQNLLESNAGLAQDLRDTIYTQINQNKSDKEIINYLVSRYGNFILYQPPVNTKTLALWFGPLIILIGGLTSLIFYLRSQKKINSNEG